MNGSLRAFTTNSSRQLNIFWHDRDALGVNRAQVGVFKQASQVRFGRFLQRQDSVRLESQISLEVLGDFSDQALKRQLADQEFGRFLVFSVFFCYEQDEKRTVREEEEERERPRREKKREEQRKERIGSRPRLRQRAFFPIYNTICVSIYATRSRANVSHVRTEKTLCRAKTNRLARSWRVYASRAREDENRFPREKHRQN